MKLILISMIISFCFLSSPAAVAGAGFTPVDLVEEFSVADTMFVQTFPDGSSFMSSIPNGQTTPSIVNVEFPPNISWMLELDGSRINYQSGDHLFQPGEYRFVVISGNYFAEFGFTITDIVTGAVLGEVAANVRLAYQYYDDMFYYRFPNGHAFSASLPNGGVTSFGVRLLLDRDLITLFTRDGEIIRYSSGDILTEEGYYFVRIVAPMAINIPDLSLFFDGGPLPNITSFEELEQGLNELLFSGQISLDGTPDSLIPGNNYQTYFTFRIISQPTNSIAVFNFPEGFGLTAAYRDGQPIEATAERFHRFTRDGDYAFILHDTISAAPAQTVLLTIDTTPPLVTMEGGPKWGVTDQPVSITAEPGAALMVYRDGIELMHIDEFSQPGSYFVIASDSAGNVTSFEFVITFTPSRTYVLLAMLIAAAASVVYIIYWRFSMVIE